MTIRYKNYDCEIQLQKYQANKAIAISLVAANTQHNLEQDVFPHEPICTATVCIPDATIKDNQTFIRIDKNDTEILDVLIANKIIEDTGIALDLGYIENGARLVNIINK